MTKEPTPITDDLALIRLSDRLWARPNLSQAMSKAQVGHIDLLTGCVAPPAIDAVRQALEAEAAQLPPDDQQALSVGRVSARARRARLGAPDSDLPPGMPLPCPPTPPAPTRPHRR